MLLKKTFDEFAKESREYFNYTLLAESHKRFFKRKEEVEVDCDYALAKASRMVSTSKETKILQQHKREEDKIEGKLDDLKKELEEINELDEDLEEENEGLDDIE